MKLYILTFFLFVLSTPVFSQSMAEIEEANAKLFHPNATLAQEGFATLLRYARKDPQGH